MKVLKKQLQISEVMIIFVIKTNTCVSYKYVCTAHVVFYFLPSDGNSLVNTNTSHSE